MHLNAEDCSTRKYLTSTVSTGPDRNFTDTLADDLFGYIVEEGNLNQEDQRSETGRSCIDAMKRFYINRSRYVNGLDPFTNGASRL